MSSTNSRAALAARIFDWVQIQGTATFGRVSFFPSVFDPGARYSVDPAYTENVCADNVEGF
jgi:hypothetical protein